MNSCHYLLYDLYKLNSMFYYLIFCISAYMGGNILVRCDTICGLWNLVGDDLLYVYRRPPLAKVLHAHIDHNVLVTCTCAASRVIPSRFRLSSERNFV